MSGLAKNLLYSFVGEDKSASSTMERIQSVAEKTTGKIGGSFTTLGSKLGGEFGEILSKVGEGVSQVGEHTGKLSTVLATGGGVVTGVGVAMQQMGSADKQASDQLKQSIETSGHSYEDYRDEIEKTITKQEGYGHGATDTQQALQRMTSAFQDPKKAMADLGVATDLAASKHIGLADAADLVVRITSGKGAKTLSQYGITMGAGKDKTVEAQKALEELSKKIDGQANASMNNFGSQVNVVKTRLTDWGASVSNTVGPALTAIGPVLMATGAAMEIFKTISGAVKASQLAQAAATDTAAIAQRGFNLSMLANPIMIVIVAIVALVAGLIWFFTQTKLGQEIWKNFTKFLGDTWKNFSDFFATVWNGLVKWFQDAIGVVVSFVKQHWGLLLSFIIGPIGLAIQWVVEHWSSIVAFFQVTVARVGSFFGGIGTAIQNAFSGAVGFVKDAINGVIDAIDGAIGGINQLIGAVNSIPGVHVPTLGKLPHLALGGVITRPTMVLAGESGPEAIVPLNSGGRYGMGGGASITFQVDVHAGAVGSEQHLAKTVIDALVNAIRSGGINKQELLSALGV